MKEKKRVKEFLLNLLSTLILFVILSGIFLAVTVWSESSTLNVSRNNLVEGEQQLASTETSVIYNRVSRLTSDLTYIRDTLNLVGLTPEHYGNIEKQWISFADHQCIYDQICFMDTKGNELIRVNYSRDGSYAVPAKQLQNKAEDYYFQRALPLAANQIYISRLDLSVEAGIIETPVKPMIRLAIPYYDTTGTLRGVVCLKYLAEDMLARVRSVGTGGNGGVFLLSSEGYWLYDSENAGREWGFMATAVSDAPPLPSTSVLAPAKSMPARRVIKQKPAASVFQAQSLPFRRTRVLTLPMRRAVSSISSQ